MKKLLLLIALAFPMLSQAQPWVTNIYNAYGYVWYNAFYSSSDPTLLAGLYDANGLPYLIPAPTNSNGGLYYVDNVSYNQVTNTSTGATLNSDLITIATAISGKANTSSLGTAAFQASGAFYPSISNPLGYLTANQAVTLSGDVTGTGTTEITTTVGALPESRITGLVTDLAGKYSTSNPSGYITTSSLPTFQFQNVSFVSGQINTNTNGCNIQVWGNTTLTPPLVLGVGITRMELRYIGVKTNFNSSSSTAALLAPATAQPLSMMVSNNGTYCFSNTSTVGTATVIDGQIQFYK